MKNVVILFVLCFLMISTSCAQEEDNSLCKAICDNNKLVKRYEGETGIIRELVIGDNPDGESYDFLFDDSNSNDGKYLLHVILTGDNDLLVPCRSLSDAFKYDSLVVNFSGNKYDCCNLLTQPNVRASFGCEFEVTSIEPLTDK